MTFAQIVLLAVVQGLAELLPVSSSAHVIVAEKLMGLDPAAPSMTLLLVMLHTGTMFAVILFFWRDWKAAYFASRQAFGRSASAIALATVATGVVSLVLLRLIPIVIGVDRHAFEVEQLFGNPWVMAAGLAAAGVFIIASGLRRPGRAPREAVGASQALAVGAVQGLCLPFRGFSRSGATISTGLALGVARRQAEAFSFALAVVLTPAVIAKEGYRFVQANAETLGHSAGFVQLAWPSLVGMALSFVAGLGALRWLSSWLDRGRWHYFGIYCLAASVLVLVAQRWMH